METKKIIKDILDEYKRVCNIWQFKNNKSKFIIFKNVGDLEGIYYNAETKDKEKEKDVIDFEALREVCDLVYSENNKDKR